MYVGRYILRVNISIFFFLYVSEVGVATQIFSDALHQWLNSPYQGRIEAPKAEPPFFFFFLCTEIF